MRALQEYLDILDPNRAILRAKKIRLAQEAEEANPISEEVDNEEQQKEALDQETEDSTNPEVGAKEEQASIDNTEDKVDSGTKESVDESATGVEKDETAEDTDDGVDTGEQTNNESEEELIGKESELVFYGKIVNLKELENAEKVEKQEQYEIKIPKTKDNAVAGRIRVRKTTCNGKVSYEITTKTKLPDGSNYEANAATDAANFVQFKYMAESGMIKDRYIFPIEGYKEKVKWEVDVYRTRDDVVQEWVKIDLEVKDKDIHLDQVPEFPIELSNIITNQEGDRTEEEETILRTLYDTVFTIRNPVISTIQSVEAPTASVDDSGIDTDESSITDENNSDTADANTGDAE